MSDRPDYMASFPADMPQSWPGFQHGLALVPAGRTLDELRATPRLWATFLIEPDSADEVLNGQALPAYLAVGVPVLMHARRARDLRPFLRRAEALARRGYRVEALT